MNKKFIKKLFRYSRIFFKKFTKKSTYLLRFSAFDLTGSSLLVVVVVAVVALGFSTL